MASLVKLKRNSIISVLVAFKMLEKHSSFTRVRLFLRKVVLIGFASKEVVGLRVRVFFSDLLFDSLNFPQCFKLVQAIILNDDFARRISNMGVILLEFQKIF